MSTAIGGSIQEIGLDGRNFAVTADSGAERHLGGSSNDVKKNGNGTVRLIKTQMPFKLGGLKLSVDDENGDQEFLQELANRNGLFPITITFASGVIYQGSGQIIGEINYSNEDASASVDLSGNILAKQ